MTKKKAGEDEDDGRGFKRERGFIFNEKKGLQMKILETTTEINEFDQARKRQ